jgi:hypothetical protein
MAKTNRLAFSVLVVLSLAAFAAAQSYTVTDLGPGQAFAINGLGDVVVQPYPSGNSFVWSPGGKQLSLTPLTAGYPTTPYGINNQGLVVGVSLNGQVSPRRCGRTVCLSTSAIWESRAARAPASMRPRKSPDTAFF